MEKFNSFYLGIVVQNNDPEYRGRVKVWVPHVNASVYNKWNALKQDRSFKFPGTNISSDLSLILDELKEDLPWAEFASPVVGESAAGVYNARFTTASVSDAQYSSSLSGTNYSDTLPSDYNLNSEQMGEKPGLVYEKYQFRPTDAFVNSTVNSKGNPYGASYRPSTYSNAAKGLFSVPSVGSHVWLFFSDGMQNRPVYFATAYDEKDWSSIFKTEDGTTQDYPGAFENKGAQVQPNEDINNVIYRNKMVLNQRGAAMEIINTTDRESFKITQYSGGYLELNNYFNSLFSPKNLQLLTLQDRFETVKGHNSNFTGRDYEHTSRGNYTLNVGSLNKKALDEWVTAYTAIADILALPEGDSAKNDLADVVAQQANALAAAEAKLGFGGNYIETITKHKFTNVGLTFNSFASYRVSNTAKAVNQYRNVVSSGTQLTQTNIDLIEYTHIDDMPGGNFTETIGNRYNLLVGSGGIDIKTTGPINVGGTIMVFGGTQMNLASKEDFNIDGGTSLSVIADIINIRSRNRAQTVIDDNLGVSKNLVIGGGSYTEGEVYLQHVTAPVEFQVTESTTIQDTGYTISGATITKSGGGTISSGNIVSITGGTLTINQPHTHYFKNLPLTLLATNSAVRNAAASAVNGGTAAATATAVVDHYNTAGGNKNSDPNGPINGVPG